MDIIGYANHGSNSGGYTPGSGVIKNANTQLQVHGIVY